MANRKVEERMVSLRDELLGNVNHKKFNGILQTLDILKYSSISEKFLNSGDQAPDFILPNAFGKWFSLKEEVKTGKAVLVFIRGGWSPYCYLQLRSLQKNLNEIKALGVKVFAISCEKPDYCLNTMERNGLQFEVLSDRGNRVAEHYNLVYKNENSNLLSDLGLMPSIKNADVSYQLPLPATFIVDEWMTLRYAFVNPDYRLRPRTEDLLEKLKAMY